MDISPPSSPAGSDILQKIIETIRQEVIEGIFESFYDCDVTVTKSPGFSDSVAMRIGEYSIIIRNRHPSSARICPVCGKMQNDASGIWNICNHEGTQFFGKEPAHTQWVNWNPPLNEEGILALIGLVTMNMNSNLILGNYEDIELKRIAFASAKEIVKTIFVENAKKYINSKKFTSSSEFSLYITTLAINFYSVISKGKKGLLVDRAFTATERKEYTYTYPKPAEEEKKPGIFNI